MSDILSRSILITNLPPNFQNTAILHEKFIVAGNIEQIKLGESKAIIIFEEQSNADDASVFAGSLIDGYSISISSPESLEFPPKEEIVPKIEEKAEPEPEEKIEEKEAPVQAEPKKEEIPKEEEQKEVTVTHSEEIVEEKKEEPVLPVERKTIEKEKSYGLSHEEVQTSLGKKPEQCPFMPNKEKKGISGEELIKILQNTNVPIRKSVNENDIFNVLIKKQFVLVVFSLWALVTLFSNVLSG